MHRLLPRLILSIIIAHTASGCLLSHYANGAAFAPSKAPDGKGVVVFFRERMMKSSAVRVFMSIPASADNCFEMASGGYYAYPADPGRLDVTAIAAFTHATRADFGITVKAGETHYVQIELHGGPHLTEVSESQAQEYLGDTKQVAACQK